MIENPNHVKDLLKTRKKAQLTKQQELFLSLGKTAETYLEGLAAANKNLGHAIQRLLELRQSYGTEALLIALEVATQYKAYDVSYVENILYQKSRPITPYAQIRLAEPSLNELQLEEPDLLMYDAIALKKRRQNHDQS